MRCTVLDVEAVAAGDLVVLALLDLVQGLLAVLVLQLLLLLLLVLVLTILVLLLVELALELLVVQFHGYIISVYYTIDSHR